MLWLSSGAAQKLIRNAINQSQKMCITSPNSEKKYDNKTRVEKVLQNLSWEDFLIDLEKMKIVHVIKHVFILFFSYLHNAEECLNRPDTGIRSCTSTKMNSYSDKSESERILWSKTQVLSGMKCSLLCIEDISCVSYFYNNSTQTCTGHSIMFGNSSAASNQDGNVFYHFIDGR